VPIWARRVIALVLLSVDNLHVHYGRIAAVRGVSLEVDSGEIVCITGPNGAGKSSTLLAIAGGQKPSIGTIQLEGHALGGRSAEQIARLGVSLVPEGRHVFATLTVEENLHVATMMRSDRARIKSDIEEIMERFPILLARRRTPAGRLSGGEQQQLVIARALLTRPKILLLDEPSLGLAPLMVDTVYEILGSLRKSGLTMLIVEQSVSRALEVSDRLYVLRTGKVEYAGTGAELDDPRKLRQAYFGYAGVGDI
jgi:branched-chain amino acid transport system ATP-binding protein